MRQPWLPAETQVQRVDALARATLMSGPIHPYQIARLLRHRGKDDSIKIRYGSLYTVVQDLESRGFVEAEGTARAGHRPERTVYRLTDDGQRELEDRIRELISEPVKEYPLFTAALSLVSVIHPDELAGLLAERLQALEIEVAATRSCSRRPSSEPERTSRWPLAGAAGWPQCVCAAWAAAGGRVRIPGP